ncbi:MAG: helix-turn-helix domain-containing protein, partial [Cetobacterium sp.]
MVINERCINILSVLNETNKFTLKKLSESFDVHERTIRYDIDNINYILKTYKLDEIKKCDGGVFTVNLKSSELNKIISDFGGMFSENRKSYLKLKIFSAEMINLTKEAEFLNVSRTTLKKDMNTIKNELKEQGIEIQELPSKGIKVEGDSDYIVRAFAKELQKLIENQFVNLPNILKDTVGKIVGDITPNVLKSRVENILGERYSLIEYNKVFCRLAALNTRFKLERKKRGYNIEEVNTFVMCSQGKEFISKITSEEYKAKDNISGFQNVFKNVIDTLELNSCTEIFENLLSSIKHNKDNKELVNVSEKICETNFYKEFAKKLENSELLEKEI